MNDQFGIIHKGIPVHIPGQMAEFSEVREAKGKKIRRHMKKHWKKYAIGAAAAIPAAVLAREVTYRRGERKQQVKQYLDQHK